MPELNLRSKAISLELNFGAGRRAIRELNEDRKVITDCSPKPQNPNLEMSKNRDRELKK
jgi:hypothetical protein